MSNEYNNYFKIKIKNVLLNYYDNDIILFHTVDYTHTI